MEHHFQQHHQDTQKHAGGDAGAGSGGGGESGLFHGIFDAMKQMSQSVMKGEAPDMGKMVEALTHDIYGGKS